MTLTVDSVNKSFALNHQYTTSGTFTVTVRMNDGSGEVTDSFTVTTSIATVQLTLSEDEIRSAWRQLATEEGVFCEPASAAGLAALLRLGAGTGDAAVCILTGHGLKDTESLEASMAATSVDASLDAVLTVLQ